MKTYYLYYDETTNINYCFLFAIFCITEYNKTEKLYNAVISAIKSVGLSIDFVDDLGGARGVSKSGSIDILKDAPKNIGTVSTIIHEFSHELLHQKYLSNKSKDEFEKITQKIIFK